MSISVANCCCYSERNQPSCYHFKGHTALKGIAPDSTLSYGPIVGEQAKGGPRHAHLSRNESELLYKT